MEIISVIIPVYNKEDYVEKCLSSVINQTYKELEIVVIDDGSTDNSAEIIKGFVQKDQRIKFISQENKGHSEARNVGILNSTGNYMFFLDADDFLPNSEVFEIMYRNSGENNSDIVIGEIVSSCKEHTTLTYNDVNIDFSKNGLDVMQELIKKGKYYAVMCSKLYRSYLIRENNLFFEKLINDDEEWTPKIFSYAKKVSFTKQECYHRVVLETSVTGVVSEQNSLRKANDKITVCKSLDSFFDDKYLPAISKLIFSFYLASIYSLVFDKLPSDSENKLNYKLKNAEYIISHGKSSYLMRHRILYYFYKIFGFDGLLKLVKILK